MKFPQKDKITASQLLTSTWFFSYEEFRLGKKNYFSTENVWIHLWKYGILLKLTLLNTKGISKFQQ